MSKCEAYRTYRDGKVWCSKCTMHEVEDTMPNGRKWKMLVFNDPDGKHEFSLGETLPCGAVVNQPTHVEELPIDPTDEMIKAGDDSDYDSSEGIELSRLIGYGGIRTVYMAMVQEYLRTKAK